VIVNDVVDAQALVANNEILRRFDIVAARTNDAKCFEHLCRYADVDVISPDFSRMLNFGADKKLLDAATARGIHFEICYSPMVKYLTARRCTLTSTRVWVHFLRGGRHLILSSGAETALELRGPMDVLNIGKILGMTEAGVHSAMDVACTKVLEHGMARKRRFLAAEVLAKEGMIRCEQTQAQAQAHAMQQQQSQLHRVDIIGADLVEFQGAMGEIEASLHSSDAGDDEAMLSKAQPKCRKRALTADDGDT
jgi:RNase P/RNase MRP subunit p30